MTKNSYTENLRDITNQARFWKITHIAKLEAEYDADRKLSYLETAPIEVLTEIFHEYRFFIKYFISDLGLPIFKAPFGKFKCIIAKTTVDELGDSPEKTHLTLWDNFLVSLGDNPETLEHAKHPQTISIMEALRKTMLEKSFYYGVGLRGMGGECLCQVYLRSAYKHLLCNPGIHTMQDQIDWTFWDIHTGAEDSEHVELVRNAIADMLRAEPTGLAPLAAGYFHAKRVWERFWGNLFIQYGDK